MAISLPVTLPMLILGLIAVAYGAINLGSTNKDRMPLAKIALPIAVACVIGYLLYPLFAPLVAQLYQFSMHLPLFH